MMAAELKTKSEKQTERWMEIHQAAMASFNRIQDACREEREQARNDRRFANIAGAAWEGGYGDQFENKPRMEVNKIQNGCIKIINDYHENKIDIQFLSNGFDADDRLIDDIRALKRADENRSNAAEAFDNAMHETVYGGYGAFRLCNEYEDERDPENFHQRIAFKPIFDADTSVFFSLDAQRMDKADATECFVVTGIPRQKYIDEWKDDPVDWPKEMFNGGQFDWTTPDVVYVAEYFKVEYKKRVSIRFDYVDGSSETHFKDELDEETLDELTAKGAREVARKTIKQKRVHKWLMSGGGVLEDCGTIAGEYIPVVMVYGKRLVIDGVERSSGHVRLPKDAQRLLNMEITKLAEISAYSAYEKPIVTPEQVAGLEEYWEKDNIKNYPYLLLNPITDKDGNLMPAGPVGYTKPPAVPPALAALMGITDQYIRDLLGNQVEAPDIKSNVSGDALDIFYQNLDMQSHIYITNMAKALTHAGRIWLSMAKDVYTEHGRKIKAIDDGGEPYGLELLQPIRNDQGLTEYRADFKRADFDVVSSVGPKSSNARNALVRRLSYVAQYFNDEQTKQILGAMVMMNLDGEGVSDVRQYFRKKLISMGVIDPTEEEAQELIEKAQNAQPDANQTYLMAAAEEAVAKAMQARSTTALNMARAESERAQTVETLTEIERKDRDQALKTIDTLGISKIVQG